MASVTIDGREYDADKMSEAARQQVVNVAAVDEELRRLQALVVICQTARISYANALKAELDKSEGGHKAN